LNFSDFSFDFAIKRDLQKTENARSA